ncbi:IS5/IS1182 family transposase [Limnoglobus roseus]|uniref:IS5/IS1182 family transposase n=1 Tax=Limnoglobus roseus TaxID=2598579 RepID=A0A5C1AJ21_9BACT|nr:transposase [Limnoglobus roseus]QEL18655.1 IS5/IS1182 family transposase [Limnoglobus roseus]
MLSGVFHRLRTGCPWRDLPGRSGPWQNVYERFASLRASGRLADILAALQLRLNAAGRIDHALYCVDGTNGRAVIPRRKDERPGGPPAVR